MLNVLLGVLAFVILAVQAAKVAVSALRSRRSGAPSAMVGAGATAQLIGLGLALAGAVGGGYITFTILQLYPLQPLLHLVVQVLAAVIASWLVGRVYFAWLAKPVYTWFAGEEGARNDG